MKQYSNNCEVQLHTIMRRSLESQITKRLLQLHKCSELSKELHNRIKPVGAQRPRMYGLPKTHKENVPLRRILSMFGSAQHELAKCLGDQVLQPALDSLLHFVIKDSFIFAEAICAATPTSADNIIAYFEIKSLFTNVPLIRDYRYMHTSTISQ